MNIFCTNLYQKKRVIIKIHIGLSTESRRTRKKKNIVSTKVNFLAWVLQMLSIVAVVIPFIPLHIRELFWRIINLAGPPLLYLYISYKERAAVHPEPQHQVFVIPGNSDTSV